MRSRLSVAVQSSVILWRVEVGKRVAIVDFDRFYCVPRYRASTPSLAASRATSAASDHANNTGCPRRPRDVGAQMRALDLPLDGASA